MSEAGPSGTRGGTADGAVRNQRIHVIINARSGAGSKEAIAAHIERFLAARGAAAVVELAGTPADLLSAAARAADGDAEIVVAGGGDGTVAAVASAVLDRPKLLAVLPLGTFNYFVQRIGIPLDLDGALEVLLTGVPVPIGVGEVNGRVFLNNSSIGLYPAVLRQRESTYGLMGRSQAAAYLSVAAALLQPPALLNLHIEADGVPLARRTPLLFVGVNGRQLATFGIPGEECLDGGRLALYITRPLSALRLWGLALRAFFRGLHGAGELEVACAQDVRVTLRRRRVRVAIDGEVARLRTPLRYRMRMDALRVLTTARPAAADGR